MEQKNNSGKPMEQNTRCSIDLSIQAMWSLAPVSRWSEGEVSDVFDENVGDQ